MALARSAVFPDQEATFSMQSSHTPDQLDICFDDTHAVADAGLRPATLGRRNAYEMAAAMVLPVLPFLCLVWFDVTKSAQCGAYCATTIVAMLVLMRYRRSTYSMAM
jgi:hypothetical protein